MKVKYKGTKKDFHLNWALNTDPRKLLNKGQIYQIAIKEIYFWCTRISLHEYPGKFFDYENFESA
jgi:hypothetical protein